MHSGLNIISDTHASYCISSESDYYKVWQNQIGCSFVTSDGLIKVIRPGIRNDYSGPDFRQAVVKFSDGKIRCGDVEIHIKNSDWEKHHHTNNPAYKNVILHVIGQGDPKPVWLNKNLCIPTISLKNQQYIPQKLCKNFGNSDILKSFIESESYQRWEYHQSFFKNEMENSIERIFSFVYNKETYFVKDYSHIFLKKFYKHLSDKDIIESMVKIVSEGPWIMGRRRPMNHPKYKISILTYISLKFMKIPKFPENYSWNNLLDDVKLLSNSGFLTPGRSFLKEILGNIIYPLKQTVSSEDCFQDWFSFPIQPYGLIRRKFDLWGVKIPLSNGIQQGILQIDKDYCQISNCEHCPLKHYFY